MLRPVRVGANNILLNTYDGWLTERPPIASWIGLTTDDYGPIGPGSGQPFGWSDPGGVPAAADRAQALIVGPLVSACPVRWYRGAVRGTADSVELDPPLWFTDPHLAGGRPGPGGSLWPAPQRRTGETVWGELLRLALWCGRSFLAFVEGDGGTPLAGSVRVLSPAMVDLEDDGPGWVIGSDDDTAPDVTTDADGRFTLGGVPWRLVQLHEPLGTGGVVGRHGASLQLGIHVRNYTSGTFRSGVPNGYLKVSSPSLNQEQADKLKAAWLAAHGGDRRSIAVLNATTDFTPISVKPVDAQLVDVDGLVLRMIAHAFNLPASALDSGAAGGSLTYANITQDDQRIVVTSLRPWAAAFDSMLSALVPFGTWAEHDWRGYLLTDAAARTAYYQAGLRDGWLQVDEVRRAEKLPPLPDPEPVAPVTTEPAPPLAEPTQEVAPDAAA